MPSQAQVKKLRQRMDAFTAAIASNDEQAMATAYCSIRRHGKNLFDRAAKRAGEKMTRDAKIGLDRFLEQHPIPDGVSLFEHMLKLWPGGISGIPELQASEMMRIVSEANKLIQPFDARFASLPWEYGIGAFDK